MKSVQATTRQLFRYSLILAWGLLTSPTLYSQSIYSQPYTFTTLAGNAGYGFADGTGSHARFNGPSGVASDVSASAATTRSGLSFMGPDTPAGKRGVPAEKLGALRQDGPKHAATLPLHGRIVYAR